MVLKSLPIFADFNFMQVRGEEELHTISASGVQVTRINGPYTRSGPDIQYSRRAQDGSVAFLPAPQ